METFLKNMKNSALIILMAIAALLAATITIATMVFVIRVGVRIGVLLSNF